WVVAKSDEPAGSEFVGGLLNRLAAQAHSSRRARDGYLRVDDRIHEVPLGEGDSLRASDRVARHSQSTRSLIDLGNELRRLVLHKYLTFILTISCRSANILSY